MTTGYPQLLLVSLGPVQDFIASARRCQDLWAGSYLLSELSAAAAAGMEAFGGVTLIFPGALGNEKPAVANKILARLDPGVGAKDAAEAGRAAMQDRLAVLGDEALGRFDGDPRVYLEVARLQLDDLMEYLWVAVPEVDGYPDARELAEQLLAARKATRTFGPVPWAALSGAGVPKSALDAMRESVLDEALFDEVRRGDRKAESLRRQYFAKPTERLCGVALLKRVLTDGGGEGDAEAAAARPPFHSTSHVAAGPILTGLAWRPGARGAMQSWIDGLRDERVDTRRFRIRAGRSTGHASEAAPKPPFWRRPLPEVPADRVLVRLDEDGYVGHDGYLLYEGRLRELLDEYGPGASPSLERELARSLGDTLARCGVVGAPNAYYALLLADGDRMGAAIDALHAFGDGAFARHRQLSAALDDFSRATLEVVEREGGSLVYAGGDDVLALVPLHTVLDCARGLHAAFDEHIRGVFDEPTLSAMRENGNAFELPTLSIGVAVVHHMESMEAARALAKVAETAAKRDAGRNALAVALSKRSGAQLLVHGRWDEPTPLDRRLEILVGLLASDALPDGIAYELEALLAPWELGGAPPDEAGPALLALARRSLGRKRQGHGAEAISRGVLGWLEARLGASHAGPDAARAIADLSAEIQVARALLTAYEQAWRPASARTDEWIDEAALLGALEIEVSDTSEAA